MADREAFKAALNELEAAQAELRGIVHTGQEGWWRNELVRKRRAMAMLVSRLAEQLDDFERQADRAMPTAGIREKLSEFRSALAMHQATYPVVVIERNDNAYRRSVDQVGAKCAELCHHARRAIGFG